MSDWIYNCDWAENQLVAFTRLLAETGALTPPDEGLLRHCVQPCGPCRRGGTIKRCEGWRTCVGRGILSFRPFVLRGHPAVRIDLSGDVSFQRAKPQRADGWESRPVAHSTVTAELIDVDGERLLERHHHDLANIRQEGPIWHLQCGGNPQGDIEALPTGWLTLPRWAMPPMDLTLLAEAITYNFYRAEWHKLNSNGTWINLVLNAEKLMMSHFAAHMHAHFSRADALRDSTWLTAQDNATGALDPRPKL